jgi:hypothetical protein
MTRMAGAPKVSRKMAESNTVEGMTLRLGLRA